MPLYPVFIVLMAVGVGCFLVTPEMVEELGFQLSYAAVLAILFVLRQSPWAEFMHHYQLVKHPKLPVWLLTLQISLAAWIGTLPLVSHHFGGAGVHAVYLDGAGRSFSRAVDAQGMVGVVECGF